MWIVCAHCAIGYLLYFGLFSYCSIRYTQHGIHAAVGSSRHAVIRAGRVVSRVGGCVGCTVLEVRNCNVYVCLSVSRESWIAKLRLLLLWLCQGHAESRRQEAPRPVARHHGPA